MKVSLTVAGLFLMALASAQSADDKKTEEILARNRIKTQTSKDFKYSGNKLSTQGVKTSVTLYATNGEVTQVTTFNPKGQVVNVEKYQYDQNGNRTEYSRFTGGTVAQPAYQKLSKYNNDNLLTEESGYDGVDNFQNTYNYNNSGDLLEILYKKNNALTEKRVFLKDGNTTTVSIYNPSGTMSSKMILRYDNRKNLVEEAVYGINQTELEKKTYHYDEKKNLKEEAKYKLDKVTLRTLYNYDDNGNLTDISEESPGTTRFIKKSFAYNSKGLLQEIKWRRRDNEDFNQITYSYDENDLCTNADTWYPATKYHALTKYLYDTY